MDRKYIERKAKEYNVPLEVIQLAIFMDDTWFGEPKVDPFSDWPTEYKHMLDNMYNQHKHYQEIMIKYATKAFEFFK